MIMNTIVDANNSGLKVGDRIAEYRIERIELLKEISSIFYALEHLPTGARHVHISNGDNENTFSVAFKTVPVDSTGVAHILEHTVLCGSNRFPVRDPFFSMLKRSLNTFMNAFTSSDWTMYPFSTQNPKDYYNLMDVYLDAAFFPNLDQLDFLQEGHRVEFAEPDNPDALYMSAVCRRYSRDFEEALEFVERLKEIWPEHGRAHQEEGHNYRDLGRPQDTYAQAPSAAQFRVVTRKPVRPSDAEIERNPRSRSARLRVLERVQ